MDNNGQFFYADTTAYYCEQELQEADSVLLTLVQGYNWPGTLHRISTHPSEAEDIGMQGRTPLHVACDHDAPPVVIKALMQAYPEASTMVGTSNMNPLHITCSSQHASVEVVRVLLQEGGILPATMRDVDGDTPLHAACRCGAPIEVLDELIRANPLAVDERDYEGLTPLLRLWVRYFVILGDNFINSVKSPADINGELAEAWNKTDLLLQASHRGSTRYYNGKVEKGSTTSHRRLMYRQVHAVSAVDCPRPVVKIATIIHPDQLTERDENGLLPIMIAASTPIFKVHDLSDEGYQLEDRIHGDEVNGQENNEFEENDMSSMNNDCNTQPSVLEILLEAAPETAKVRDPYGRLPLHRAIASGKTWSFGVKTLVEAHPEGIMTKDRKTKLYPYKLAASDSKSDCTTIYELLRSNPSLVTGGIHSSYASNLSLSDYDENVTIGKKCEEKEDFDKKPKAGNGERTKDDDNGSDDNDERKPKAKINPEEVKQEL